MAEEREKQLVAEFTAPVWGEHPFNEVECLEGSGSFSGKGLLVTSSHRKSSIWHLSPSSVLTTDRPN